jgi:hypothetical protein
MPGPIPGISRTSLWSSWKVIRKALDDASIRDVVDFLDYDIEPEVWIRRLLRQIADGTYEPSTPRRFALGKSKGFTRVMTFPTIPDLVLYRTIVNHLYRRIRRRQHAHVYFDRTTLVKVQAAATHAARQQMTIGAGAKYGPTGVNRFLAWLHYDQYRRHLLFQHIYPFIVTCDVANFFDTILYSSVMHSLHGVAAPPRMIALLFLLLERLSIRRDFTESFRIGLPIDEFECSRTLAHMLLFPHDDRMVGRLGEDAYIRWMDDQNMGARSRSDALSLLGAVQASLAVLHLTPNSQKSRIFSLREAKQHFHLEVNSRLDRADALPHKSGRDRHHLGSQVKQVWRRARQNEGIGEWDKILKRIYRLAGLARSRMFRRRAAKDILQNPELAKRIVDYMRCTGTVQEFLQFACDLWQHDEQVYPDVNLRLIEALLRLEPSRDDAKPLRAVASDLLTGRLSFVGWSECAAVAPLLILRFGDRRSLPLLKRCLENAKGTYPPAVVRAAAVVVASYGLREFRIMRRVAGKALTRELATMVQLIEHIQKYSDVPNRYRQRFQIRFDAVAGHQYVDMHGLLSVRLLNLSDRPRIRSWVAGLGTQVATANLSHYDRKLLKRLLKVGVP